MPIRQYLEHLNNTTTENVEKEGVVKRQAVAPSKDILRYAEIAINYAKDCETMFIKNDNDEIVRFYPVEPLTDEQLALFEYVRELMREALQEEFDSKFTVNTTTNPASLVYFTDENTGMTFNVSATTKFDSNNVSCGTVTGWNNGGVGIYTKNGVTRVEAQAFTYTATEGKYAGLSTTKNSSAKSVSSITPFYYGWYTSNNANSANTAIGTLTRYTNGNTGTITFTTQPPQNDMYLWIIVGPNRSARATQVGQSLEMDVVTKNITSPKTSSITLSNYKVYISHYEFSSNSGIQITVS